MSASLCRICLIDADCTRNIFTGRCSNGQSYAEALMNLIDGITVIENDSMPSHLCETCVSRLESSVTRGVIVDGFASQYRSSEYVPAGAGIKTEPESEENLRVLRTETNSDAAADVVTEEICLKTEPDDEYFRIDLDESGTSPYEKSVDDESQNSTRQLKVDAEKKPYGCDLCEMTFDRKINLNLHLRTHADRKPYECDLCGKKFGEKHNLTNHFRTHTGEKPYECERCKKTFRYKSNLTVHLRMHDDERPYECDRCGKKYRNNYNLTNHLRTHTGEKPYECERCEKAFTGKQELVRHFRTHAGEKPYECDSCGKAFTRKQDLMRHLRMHTGERPYGCDLCGKAFGGKRDLTRHLRTHATDKPYECDRCGKKFGEKSNLSKHFRVHTGEKPYECGLCGKAFSDKSNLAKHLRTYAGDACVRKCADGAFRTSMPYEHERSISDGRPHKILIESRPVETERNRADRSDAIVTSADIKPEEVFLKMEPVDEYF